MAELKALQKSLIGLLHQQLSQYFKQIQILSYKPSRDGKVLGRFIGDQRNYNFILSNKQVQYLPSTTKMDSQRFDRANALTTVCSGSNHPCKGEKGTRCVPQNQSCKQNESSTEGIARLEQISDTSKQITALVTTGKPSPDPKFESKQNAKLVTDETKSSAKPSSEAPELDKDISLYDFMKYYSPWNAKGSEGYDKAKLRDVKRSSGSNKKTVSKQSDIGTPSAKPESKPFESKQNAKFVDLEPETNSKKKEPEAKQGAQPEPETKPRGLGGGAKRPEPKQEPSQKTEEKAKSKQPDPKNANPYDFLGVSPKDFSNEAALYKAAKVAYRNLAVKYHPDKGGNPKLMVELNNVMDRLKSIENKRKAKERGDSRYGFAKHRRKA